MSMFDYDARPVTPGVVLVGTAASRGGYAIRDFLSRNGYPFEWVDAAQPEAVRAVLGVAEVEPSALPLCILPDGSRLTSATVERVAAGLGMVAAPAWPEYDLAIVGAGPAGLAAAVNAASEGLRTVVVEAVAPGGHAGTTSMIENLLGFPAGIDAVRQRRRVAPHEMRALAASPDYVVGSVHALTEGGSLLIASASGSQLGPLVSGAGRVILVIGAQKIVSDVATGLRRIYEYCYPLEDARARQAYGVPSGVNNIVIINKVITPGRVTAIIVKERLGF